MFIALLAECINGIGIHPEIDLCRGEIETSGVNHRPEFPEHSPHDGDHHVLDAESHLAVHGVDGPLRFGRGPALPFFYFFHFYPLWFLKEGPKCMPRQELIAPQYGAIMNITAAPAGLLILRISFPNSRLKPPSLLPWDIFSSTCRAAKCA